MEEKKILLTISLLVSNRIDTIKKCMESIRPLLEKIPSELIAVDTVGEDNSDGSLQVVKEYATKTVRFEWCDDFAAARNAGLSVAEGEWFLYLDDDEWFDSVDEIIQFFKSGQYRKYFSATYQIRNYTEKTGTKYNVAVLGRMVRRTETLCFVGRIHETFSEMSLPCKEFSSFVHHYGYAYSSEEEKQQHRERNEALLKKELANDPGNLRYRTQMALELATYNNEKALEFCEETFQLCAEDKEKNNFQWQLALVFRLYEALGVSGEQSDAKYVELKKKFGYNEITENAIAYQMVRIHIINNAPEKAYVYAEKFFHTRQFLKEHPEIKQRQMTADFQRYQEESVYLEMLHFGAYSAWQAKGYKAAWQWYSQMPWEQGTFQNTEAFFLMIRLFRENPAVTEILDIFKRIVKNEELIQKTEVRTRISEILASLQ